jgi:molybdopterin converting factor small subunit
VSATTTPVQVRVPTILRTYTKGEADVTVDVAAADGGTTTLADVVTALDSAYPGIGARVLDDEGRIRRFVNVYLDDDDVRFADGLATAVRPGAKVSVIPAVAGG